MPTNSPMDEDGPDLGPDDRDRDLMDGSWEERYYSGARRHRDWRSIGVGLAVLVLLAMMLPVIGLFTR
jgi:hypothetical protein